MPSDRPWAEAAGCTSLLAWASRRERIACTAAADGEQRLVFFDLPEAPVQRELVALGPVRGDYRLETSQHIDNARLFADDGGRFALSTEDELYVIALNDGAPRVEVRMPTSALEGGPVQLSFSARGSYFSAHSSNGLWLWNLAAGRATPGLVPAELPEPARCTEAFFDRSEPWCGAEASGRITRWANDADAIVYRTRAGALEVQHLSRDFPESAHEVPVDDSCAEGCIVPGAYEFQP